MNNVLVAVMWQGEQSRARWEMAFVEALSRNGVTAIPSFALLPALPDSLDIIGLSAADGLDGAIVVYDFERDLIHDWVDAPPPYHSLSSYANAPYDSSCAFAQAGGDPFDCPHGEEVARLSFPSYEQVDTVLRCRIDVVQVDHECVIWSGLTEAGNPRSEERVARNVAARVMRELSRAGIVRAAP